MKTPLLIAALSAFALTTGCEVIRGARDAQRAAEPKGKGETVAAGKVALTGASLQELVAYAMTNRPSVVKARLAVEDARLQLKQLAADAPLVSDTPWTAPHLSASGGYSESSTGVRFGKERWEMSGSASAAISLELLVWDFGRYGAQAKAQAENTVAAEIALVNEGYSVFDEVASAYFTFLEDRSLMQVSLTNEYMYAEHLRITDGRLAAGEACKLDVLKARLDLAKAHQAVITASNLVDTAGAELMSALGIDASRGTWESVYGSMPVADGWMRRGLTDTTFGVDGAFAFARTNSPAIREQRARLRAASHSVDYAVRDLLPSVSISGSFSWLDPLWYWSWGVNAAQSLFQGFRKTTAIDRAVVALKEAECTVDAAEQSLSVELETAVANRDNSRSAVESARASVRSARENFETAHEQFAIGEVSRVELSDAVASLSVALGSQITSFYDGQRAEAKLYRLLGQYPSYREESVRGER